jgi:DUF4097 and DUF4098 domain-containing protein YvlB
MTEHQFETPSPIRLYVELGRGRLEVAATDTARTRVLVEGRDAAQVLVHQTDDEVTVIAPKHRGGFVGREGEWFVTIELPTGSDLRARTGSADVVLTGALNACQVRTGSGDVEVDTTTGPTLVETGSGEISIEHAAAELRLKSGSGDVRIGHADSATSISTGSGGVRIGTSTGPTAVKTGSGDVQVTDSHGDLSLSTGSGDLVVHSAHRGRLGANGASGDLHVGIPAGVPVFTDIYTMTGEIRSDLIGAGEPQEGADYVEVRAKTASGDISLHQL